jgi:hypothetical protein
MASAAFGRRNAIQPARAVRAPAAAASRGLDERPRPEAEPRAGDAVPASDSAVDWKTVVGALVLLLIAVALPLGYVSDLRRDAALKNTFRLDLSVKVEHANCTRYYFLVTSCSVQLSWPDGDARRTTDGSFLVAFNSMGGLRVMPVRSSTDPMVVTSALALDHLSNRFWTLLLVPGMCLLLSVLMLMKLLRGRA